MVVARHARIALLALACVTGLPEMAQAGRVVNVSTASQLTSAVLNALGGDEIALRLNNEVDGRCAELIFLLLGFKGLLLQFARFGGGFNAATVLFESNVSIAHVEQRGVLQLLQLGFELALRKDGALVVGLRGTVADGNLQV